MKALNFPYSFEKVERLSSVYMNSKETTKSDDKMYMKPLLFTNTISSLIKHYLIQLTFWICLCACYYTDSKQTCINLSLTV